MAAAARKGGRRRAQRTSAKKSKGERRLLRLDQPFQERRFLPKTSARPISTLVALGLGGLALGAGVYGLWFRDEALGPWPYAQYLLFAGAVLVAVWIVFGVGARRALRVGDLGVGTERGEDRVSRVAWYEITELSLQDNVLRIRVGDRSLDVSLAQHPAATSRIVAEARRRIPQRLSLDEAEVERIGEAKESAGVVMTPDPPQVTGQQCRNTDKPLMFEKDVRMCARCGALYHKSGVPGRCLECDAKLR